VHIARLNGHRLRRKSPRQRLHSRVRNPSIRRFRLPLYHDAAGTRGRALRALLRQVNELVSEQ
jgi:hypothetical protein